MALSGALVACAGRSPPPSAPVQFRLQDLRLASGLRVLIEEDHSAPVAGVVNVVGAGNAADPPGKEGLAHLVEHLTFRASPTAGRSLRSLLDQAGAAQVNATTGMDATTYWQFGQRDGLLDFLTLEGLRIVDPLVSVDAATFEVERNVAINELRERGEGQFPDTVSGALMRAALPADHPYRRSATHQSLSSLTLDDARAFVAQHYRPANMTLLITGDVKPEAIQKLLAASLSPALYRPTSDRVVKEARLPAAGAAPPSPPLSPGPVEIKAAVSRPQLLFVWSLPRSYDDQDYLSLLAAAPIEFAVDLATLFDSNIISGEVTIVPGAQVSFLVCQVDLREGADPAASAETVLSQLFFALQGTFATSTGSGELRFNRFLGRVANRTIANAENIVTRSIQRAESTHFTADPAMYARKSKALQSLDRGRLIDYYKAHLDRARARLVVLRPSRSDRSALMGPTGIAEGSTPADLRFPYDVASIPKVAVPVGLQSQFVTTRLANGLTVATARRQIVPMVTVALTFPNGYAHEATPGAAALAWRLAISDTDAGSVLGNYGGFMSRSMGPDQVTFRVHAPAAQLGSALEVLAKYVADLRVPSIRLEAFDRDVLPRIRKQQSSALAVASAAFDRALFRGHAYQGAGAFPDGGRPDEDDANRWLAATMTPARAALVIVGAGEQSEAHELARTWFGKWKGAPPPAPLKPQGVQGSPALVITSRPGAAQADVSIGCRLPPAGAADMTAYRVLARMVEQRLWHQIREAMGTSYGFHVSSLIFGEGTAVLTIRGLVDNGGLAAALKVIRHELANARSLTARDFNAGRWSVAREYNLGLATSDDWIAAAVSAFHHGWTLQTIDDVPQVLMTLDRQPLVDALVRCEKEGVLSVVGDTSLIKGEVEATWR